MTYRTWREGAALRALRWTTLAVYAIAAVGKLLDPSQVGQAVARALPWTGRASAPIGWFLIVAELAVVVCLAGTKRLLGAALAAMLAGAFALLTAVRLGMGATADCGCFGVFLALPPHATLALDISLVTSGIVLLAGELPSGTLQQHGDGALGVRGRRVATMVAVVALASLSLMGWMVSSAEGSWRAHHAMGLASNPVLRLKLGQRAPSFDAKSADEHTVRTAAAGRWRLLVFVESKCMPCRDEMRSLLPRAAAWSPSLVVQVVSRAPRRAVLRGVVTGP